MIPASTTLTSTMIPDELRQRQQWVVWKADKHPYDAKTGEAASSTDPTTWATYEQAVRAAENGGQYRGIGYVFSEDDGITGIDLDNCIDGKGVLEPWAQQIVSDLRSYTEVSPSGRGLHILSRGQLPGNGRNFGQVEMYDQGRYFCTTGKHLDGTPVDIRERSEAVTKLYTQLDARKRQENSKSQDKKYVVPAVSGRTPYGQAALVAELKNVASAPVDTRNTTLNCAAFSLGQLVASGDLAQHEVEGGLLDAAKKAGLPTDEVNITIRSGLESGKREPRSVPVNVSAGASSHANQENPEPGLTKMLGDHIAKENHFACEPDGTLYVFRCGVYQPQGDRIVKRAVKHTLERWGRSKEWSKHRANEVLEYISIDSPELWQRPLLDMINLSNGLLDVENRELRQHDPNFLSPVQLPIVYDPRAQCPEWETFIGQVFPADAQELPWELVAWLMLPDTTLQKAILLLGEGANGKSTFLAALGTFLGRRNTVALSLHKLESDRFAAVRLAGKLANICPDLPSAHLAGTDVFKRITDGTEPITAERKFHGSYDLHCYARLIFSANHPPRSPDASHAFFRRSQSGSRRLASAKRKGPHGICKHAKRLERISREY